jgi:hypothetical protein
VRRTERRLQQLKNGLFTDSQTPPSSLTFGHWLEVKMLAESAALRATDPVQRPLPAEFSAPAIAAQIMNIGDTETRRAELRRIIATLDEAQNAELREAIERLRQNRAPSWVDEV